MTLAGVQPGTGRYLSPFFAPLPQRGAHGVGGGLHEGHDLRIVHPGGTQHANGPGHAALVGVGRRHHAEVAAHQIAGLAAHEDLNLFGLDGSIEERNDGLALAQRMDELAHAVDVGKLGVLEQQALALDDQTTSRSPAFADRLVPELESAVAERVDLHAIVLQPAREELANLAEASPFDDVVEQVVNARELALGERSLDANEAVFDAAIGEHHHRQHLARTSGNEPQLRESPRLSFRCDRPPRSR